MVPLSSSQTRYKSKAIQTTGSMNGGMSTAARSTQHQELNNDYSLPHPTMTSSFLFYNMCFFLFQKKEEMSPFKLLRPCSTNLLSCALSFPLELRRASKRFPGLDPALPAWGDRSAGGGRAGRFGEGRHLAPTVVGLVRGALASSHQGLVGFHLLKNMCYFPLLVLKGIYHYWKYVFCFFPGVLTK